MTKTNNSDADELYRQFEAELSAGGVSRHAGLLERWLSRADIQSIVGHPQATLKELLLIELHWKQERQLSVHQDDYQQRFPQQQKQIAEIFEEFEIRCQEMRSASAAGIPAAVDNTAAHPESFSDGRFKTVRPLGKGGFGEVYLCRDTRLGREVAIKVPRLNQQSAEVLKGEASVLAQINCPGVPKVYEIFVERIHGRDALCMVSEFIKGRMLSEVFPAQQGSLDFDAMAATLAEIAGILQGIHSHRIWHWDLKPTNIIIGDGGKVWIVDFGLSVLEQQRIDRAGRREGTLSYMSPEQAAGKANRDGKSDIWSVGVMLYELLTGELPFQGGSEGDILKAIDAASPVSPRLSRPKTPPELERICLKCLAGIPTQRYASASELQADLVNWKAAPLQTQQQATPSALAAPAASTSLHATGDNSSIRFRGLRSYSAADADFFLQLLPGTRERNMLPPAVDFWKQLIEKRPEDSMQSVPVALVTGPSGCGKSSLMKAGVLPVLDGGIQTCVIEPAAELLESRLHQKLRFLFKWLPQEASLCELMLQLREHHRLEKKKFVLVIDQFEQWLHAKAESEWQDFANALGHCDGVVLQTILIIRSDFFAAISSFFELLGQPIKEETNCQTLKLFSLDHTRRVLHLLGRDLGRLDTEIAAGSAADQFLKQAVIDLSEEGKVIPVRLSVFVQMFSGRPWTLDSLRSIGGASGVGVAFLDQSLTAIDAPISVRRHIAAVQQVLRELLPPSGTEVRGHTLTRAEMMLAAGYQQQVREFSELLRVLEQDLRLLTQVDALSTGAGSVAAAESGSESAAFEARYELTHDYLVPSLREWLTRKQRETRKGRAELKLEERSALWNAKPENRHLPSLLEWGSIRTLTEKQKWTGPQRKMMRRAGRLHGLRSALVMAALVAVVSVGVTIRNAVERGRQELLAEQKEEQRKVQAAEIVKGLLQANVAQVKTIIGNLSDYRAYAIGDLKQAFEESPADSNARLHSALAMLPDDKSVLPFLRDRLLTVTPIQFAHVRDLLNDDKDSLLDYYWETAKTGETPTLRFQAACALASFDPRNEDWPEEDFQTFIAGHLVGVRPSELLPWTNALRPVKDHLTAVLTKIYLDQEAGEQVRSFATDTLADYLSDNPEGLFDLLADANDKQFGQIFNKLDLHREQAVTFGNAEVEKSLPDDASETEKESLAKRQANAAVMLLRMDAPDQAWPLLQHSPDPRVRSYIIHWLSPRGGDASAIIARYEQETDVTIKRALLLCLGEFELPDSDKKPLIKKLLEVYRSDGDAGLHAAAEWLLYQWGQSEQRAAIDEQLQQKDDELVAAKDEERQWYINSQGQTFVILDAGEFQMGSPETEAGRDPDETLHRRNIGRRIAISTKEVTKEQWRRFDVATESELSPDNDLLQRYMRSDDSPMMLMTWYEAAYYCNWLSEQEGISEEQWCYETNAAGEYGPGMQAKENFLDLTGYRLPTEAEWEFACRAGASSRRYYGDTDALLYHYAWYLLNTENRTYPVAFLKPNDFGLFDMQGNVEEWCYDAYEEYPMSSGIPGLFILTSNDAPTVARVDDDKGRIVRGGPSPSPSSVVRSANRANGQPDNRGLNLGFRPARTYHLFP